MKVKASALVAKMIGGDRKLHALWHNGGLSHGCRADFIAEHSGHLSKEERSCLYRAVHASPQTDPVFEIKAPAKKKAAKKKPAPINVIED